jgi:protein-disulfide isomerase
MKKLIVLVITLLIVFPTVAQEDSALPAGCNVSTLSEIFGNIGESLAEEGLTPEQSVLFIEALDSTLHATRDACAGETAPPENTLDYSEIPQSRAEDGGFVLGDPDAPITIVEFADFMCPHCQAYHPIVHELIETYVVTGQAKFEYRFFPVVDRDLSPLTAGLAECSELLNPGSFWEAHDLLFEYTSAGFNGLTPFAFAARAGLDYDEMVTCLREEAGQVSIDVTLGQEVGVGGTPTVMVRYGDGDLEAITDADGNEVPSSSVPMAILGSVIEAAQ